MAIKSEVQLELLMDAYRKLKELELHTEDPVIRDVVCDSNNYFAFVLESLEEAMKDVLLKKYIAVQLEREPAC